MAPPKATWDGSDSQGNPLRWDQPGLTWDGNIPEPTNPQPTKRMPIIHVIIGFDGMKDHDLEELAGAVSAKLYDQPVFNTPPGTVPPVDKATLDAALADFSASIPIAKQGGPEETAAKKNKRNTLIGLLRQLAAYVDGKHGNNLELLLSTGFKASKAADTPAAIIVPNLKGVKNGVSGQLLPKVDPIANCAGFTPRAAIINPDGTQGPWVVGEFANTARNLQLNNLTPGAIHAVQVKAHYTGGQHSDWSDSVMHRVM